jgi:hypothetical protein
MFDWVLWELNNQDNNILDLQVWEIIFSGVVHNRELLVVHRGNVVSFTKSRKGRGNVR